jgi:hypothetical protein
VLAASATLAEVAESGHVASMPRSKTTFKDMSPAARARVCVLAAISFVIVAAAERDIQRRSPSEVRGSKLVWRLVCLNALGALGYFRWGRRRTSR